MAPVVASAKMRGTGHDGRLLGGLQRHLDDVDAEERAVRVFLRIQARAAGEFLARADGAGARAVDVDVVRVVLRRHQRVRVGAAAGLHGGHLLGILEVGDVEDAHATEALDADRRRHALGAAVDAAARLLDRHEEQVAVDRDVALTAGAGNRRHQLRLARVLHVVGVEAVEVAHHDVDALEGEVGVGEVETAARPWRRGGRGRGPGGCRRSGLCRWRWGGRRRLGGRRAGRAFGRGRITGGVLRIEEAGRLRHARYERHVLRGGAGVLDAGLERGARIGGARQRRRLVLRARGHGPESDGDQRHHGPRRTTRRGRRPHCNSHWMSSITACMY